MIRVVGRSGETPWVGAKQSGYGFYGANLQTSIIHGLTLLEHNFKFAIATPNW